LKVEIAREQLFLQFEPLVGGVTLEMKWDVTESY
jgi:hypothetical protein